MATIAPTPSTAQAEPRAGTNDAWLRLLVWTVAVVALVDVAFMALATALIPPLAIGAVLTGIGLAVGRWRPRAGTIVLGLTSLLLLAGGLPFAVEHLAHPSSGVDFVHSVIGIFGRVAAIVMAVMVLRRASDASARRAGALVVVLLGLTLLVATVASLASTGEEAQPGDVVTAIDDHAFDDAIEVASGDTLFVDNLEPFRHTFTVEGTAIDVVTPALQGVRIPVDLEPGSYSVICDVPGHEEMSGTLVVR
jgi:plastocyanin